MKEKLIAFYDKRYKAMLFASLSILVISIVFLGFKYVSTGEFIDKGVSLKGGITLTAEAPDADVEVLKSHLINIFPDNDMLVRGISRQGRVASIIIETTVEDENALKNAIRDTGLSLDQGTYTLEYITASLGTAFFRQTIIAMILAFVAMSLVVLITFRSVVPSSFVILAAASDVVTTLSVISFFNVRLTTGGIAAFLMLIGYSVDTDILLTTRVLKRREGTLTARTLDAMRTGMLMSLTSFAAVVIAYSLTQSEIVRQIMLILSIGLFFDIIYTWAQNAGILRWHLERKEKSKQ